MRSNKLISSSYSTNMQVHVTDCLTMVQVRALESGMVLVVDEADKAPTHVTCILKNIIEGNEITLADGRRIIHKGKLCIVATVHSFQYQNCSYGHQYNITY